MQRSLALGLSACLILLSGCAGGSSDAAPTPSAAVELLDPLDLELWNVGVKGGFVALTTVGGPAPPRFHAFGQAELLCLTCVEPFAGVGSVYELTVLDESCRVVAVRQTPPGAWRLEIDLGPNVRIVPRPPPTDWVPSDSAPADPARVPCA